MCLELYFLIGFLISFGSIKAVPGIYEQFKPRDRILIVFGAVFAWFFVVLFLLGYWAYKLIKSRHVDD